MRLNKYAFYYHYYYIASQSWGMKDDFYITLLHPNLMADGRAHFYDPVIWRPLNKGWESVTCGNERWMTPMIMKGKWPWCVFQEMRSEKLWVFEKNTCETQNNTGIRLNEWCFKPRFCTCKAILGRGQPGVMRWILLWIMPLVQDRSLDLLTSSPARYNVLRMPPQ